MKYINLVDRITKQLHSDIWEDLMDYVEHTGGARKHITAFQNINNRVYIELQGELLKLDNDMTWRQFETQVNLLKKAYYQKHYKSQTF